MCLLFNEAGERLYINHSIEGLQFLNAGDILEIEELANVKRYTVVAKVGKYFPYNFSAKVCCKLVLKEIR